MATSFRSKVGLAILDIIVALMGITLFVAGIWLKLSSGLLGENAITLLNLIEYSNVRMGYMLHTISLLMMVLGGLMIIAAILGMCGAWKMIKGCLILYMLLVVMLIMAQAVLVGLQVSYHTKTDTWLRGKLLRLLTNYAGPEHTDDYSKGFNSLHMNARCCAVNAQYNDGQTNNDFSSAPSTWYNSNMGGNEKLPATCCEGATVDTVPSYRNTATCTNGPSNYYTEGCWDRMRQISTVYLIIICATCFVAMFIEIVTLILSCVVIDNAKHRVRSTGPIRGPSKVATPYVGIESVLKK